MNNVEITVEEYRALVANNAMLSHLVGQILTRIKKGYGDTLDIADPDGLIRTVALMAPEPAAEQIKKITEVTE